MGGLFARERRDRAVLKVPNRLLEMGLSPNALKLYVFLLSCADAEKKAVVSAENLRSKIQEYLEDSARAKTDREIAIRETDRIAKEFAEYKKRHGGRDE